MNVQEIDGRLADAQHDVRTLCTALASTLRQSGLIGDGAGDGPEAIRDYRSTEEEVLHGSYLTARRLAAKLSAIYAE